MADYRKTVSVVRERAVLAAALWPGMEADHRDPLGELRSLVDTAGAITVAEVTQERHAPNASTFIGKGKVEELKEMCKLHEADVVIFENDLSPAQLRNIEEIVEKKIIDRGELILDIFANRAHTYEAKLQVELAQLEYTYPRLTAMWSHLERIAGGAPAGIGTRGPGEQQLEIDRRIVQRRKAELKREIDKMQARKRREVASRNIDFFTVGLVGYTNAGKSTLFNTLTDAGAYADDKLFATLDTRTRRWDFGGGDSVMLSDTVGFVRNLPHHLVASFRATLEESIHSDLLLVVLDISDKQAEQHLRTVDDVLKQIGAGDRPRKLLLNKTDQLEDNAELLVWTGRDGGALPISAKTGVGLDKLIESVRHHMHGQTLDLTLRVPLREGKATNFIESRGQVLDRRYDTDHVTMRVRIGKRQMDQLRATGAKFEILNEQPQVG